MNKKTYIIVIASMTVIILSLIIFIIADKTKGIGKEVDQPSTETVSKETDEPSAQVEEEASSEEDSKSEDNKSKDKEVEEDLEDKKSSPKSDKKKMACYVTISDGGNWQNGKSYVYQYNIDIHNDSKEDLKNWELRISGFKNGKIGDNWNGKYEIKDDTLYITALDYNENLAKNSVISLGLQVSFDKEDDGKKDKSGEVYIDGKLYEVEKEEPTTSTAEEKEKNKKEKKTPESGTPLENHGKLSINGTDIVDSKGEKYQLKGVSTHGLAWFPEYVNKDAFKTLRDDWGANLIRLAMYTGESGGYCQDGDKDKLKSLIDKGVDAATELGMYVIIDWHILSDSNPLTNEDEAIVFFDEMSSKYSEYDNVLYEICNEPNGGTQWSDIKEYAEAVIPVIRANDKDAIIIVGTPTWSQDVEVAASDPIEGEKNIAYTTHYYAATHKENIRNKVKEAHDKGLCVFISEFSICDASGNGGIDYDSADDWSDLIDEYNLSYAGWSLCNKNETSALIASDCDKTSGWSDDELSEAGIWLKNRISGE